jgi:hypothetical protein
MPPTGGFGLNTGVQDVHTLAWKLAGVLRGVAGLALLGTYHDERQPVGRTITDQSLNNSQSMGRLGGRSSGTAIARPEYLNEQGMIFGAAYTSSAVVPDGTPAPALANPVTDYVPSARPGARAPHVWLERGGVRVSTIDLVGFVILAGRRGTAWVQAARQLASEMGFTLGAHTIGDGEIKSADRQWHAAYGVDEDGAVLVRPDGYVAWRSPSLTREPTATLRDALAAILARP